MTERELRDGIVISIIAERERAIVLAHGGDTNAFDKTNSRNDWIAYICAYAGRAAEKVARNEREGQTFSDNLVKVGALVLAALEADIKGGAE